LMYFAAALSEPWAPLFARRDGADEERRGTSRLAALDTAIAA
jgi:hypothetical protein